MIWTLQKQIVIFEHEIKLLKDREVDQKNEASGCEARSRVGLKNTEQTRISEDHIELLGQKKFVYQSFNDGDNEISKKADNIFIAQKLKILFKRTDSEEE